MFKVHRAGAGGPKGVSAAEPFSGLSNSLQPKSSSSPSAKVSSWSSFIGKAGLEFSSRVNIAI